MSKRVADGQGGAERYGGMDDPRDSAMDPPRKATAAQLAKRNIKPLKGRPSSTSRASSPSKNTPPPSFNPFGGADSNPFAQSAPAPPSASNFNFGQSTAQPQNAFAMSTSQSFPPAAPPGSNPPAAFSFGQSQPANAPSFAPPQSSSFNFGASTPSGTSFSFGASPAKPAQNGDANKTPSFTFGSTPAPAAPSAPASPASSFSNPFSAMAGPSFGGDKISAAEIHEIESAGPRLSQEGKLDELANIVRQSEPKYKDANLAGLDLSALPAGVQKKMLDFVRGKPSSTQPEAAKAPFSFSSTAPAPAASTSFSFGASTNAAPASQPDAQSSPFKGFGNNDSSAAPAASPFKFGSSAEPAQKEQSPASPFGFGAPAEKKDETPAKAPTPSFNFGGGAAASPAPAAAPSFSFGASTKSSSPAPASGFSFGNKDDAAPKAPAPAFNFGAAAATPAPVAPASPKPAEKQLPSFAFGASTNTTTPKPADQVSYPNLNGAASSQPESTPFSPAAPASSFNFGANAAPAASSPFKPAAAPNAPESPRPQNAGLGSSMFSSAPTPSKPAESAFKGFGASTSAPPQAQPSAPSTFSGFGSSTTAQSPAPATKSQAPESNALSKSSAASGFATPPASPQLKPSELASSLIKQLNESLRAHLATADTTLDWSNFMRYYLDQVSDIRHQNSAAPSATSAVAPTAPKQPLAPASTCGEKRVADEDAAKEDDSSKRSKMSFSASTTPTKPLSTTASLFDDILNSGSKPQTPQQSNVFSAAADKTPAPPATAPPAKSNPFAAITRNVSATPGPAFKPTGHSVGALQVEPTNIPKPAAPPAFQIPKFGGGAVAATGTPNFLSSFGQKAADEEAKARERRKEEDMDSDEDEEEWERRDAEEQAKKKAELEAAAKAVKFSLDTSKKADSSAKPVFSFGSQSSMTSSQSNIFGNLSNSKPDEDEDDDADTEEDEEVDAAVKQTSPAKPAAGKSLFDRVSFDADKDKSTDAPGTSFKFSSFGSNNSPAADNTWKESTGIRFGDSTGTTTPDGSPAKAAGASVFSSATPAAPAPKFSFGAASQSTPSGDKPSPFSGMFGAKSDDTPKPAASSSVSIFDSAKPSGSTGFQFGGAGASTLAPPSGSSVFASAATSRATTPGAVTTDAEGSAAESEPSDTPNEPQRDLTALTPEDLATSNLAHEARCKATKFVDKAWQAQGLGPIRILTNKETSKPRILMRTDPGGKIALNFNVILNKDLYTVKSAKMVQLTVPADGKKMETYMCTFKDKDKAEEFVAKLHEAIEKAQA